MLNAIDLLYVGQSMCIANRGNTRKHGHKIIIYNKRHRNLKLITNASSFSHYETHRAQIKEAEQRCLLNCPAHPSSALQSPGDTLVS